jgi:hypothetical protein
MGRGAGFEGREQEKRSSEGGGGVERKGRGTGLGEVRAGRGR